MLVIIRHYAKFLQRSVELSDDFLKTKRFVCIVRLARNQTRECDVLHIPPRLSFRRRLDPEELGNGIR